MQKPISRRQHAFTDYSYIPLVALAPGLVGFKGESAAARLCQIASGAVAVSSLFTRAEWGAVPVMPYKAHLVIDAALGAFALGAPWAFGFARNAPRPEHLLGDGCRRPRGRAALPAKRDGLVVRPQSLHLPPQQ